VYPLARATCEEQREAHCTFVDTRDGCGALPAPIMIDGIHPSTACSEVIAKLMWEVMEKNCADGVPVYR